MASQQQDTNVQQEPQASTPEPSPQTDNASPNDQEEMIPKSSMEKMQSALRIETQTWKDKASKHERAIADLTNELETLRAEADSPYPTDQAETVKKMRALTLELNTLKKEVRTYRDAEENSRVKRDMAKVISEQTGVSIDKLLEVDDPTKMVAKALELMNTKPAKPSPKPADPGISSAPVTASPQDMSGRDLISRGLSKIKGG